MKNNYYMHTIYFVMCILLIGSLSTVAMATTPVALGSDSSFAALAGSSITVTGGGDIWGDIGVSPGSAFTPGNPPVVVHGNIYLAVPISAQAQADLTAAYNDAAGRPTNGTLGTELGGTSPLPGVYNSAAGTFGITGTLTLDAMGDPNAVWIFQAASTLITADGSNVVLAGGASTDNIFWQVGSSATLGTNSNMKGQILAQIAITSNTGAQLTGRALARVGAVTLDHPYDSITTVGASTSPPPVAGFFATVTSGVGPYTTNFIDTSANNPTSWAWNFGDGSTSNIQHPIHQYQGVTASTTYTVQLIASNAFGTSTNTKPNYIFVSSTVGLAPVADFFGTPTSGVGPFSTNFFDISTNNPTAWAWNFGDGNTSNIQNPSHQYQAVGAPTTYTVQLIASNTFGTSTNTKPGYIYVSNTVGLAPIAGFYGTPTSGVNPLHVDFADTSANLPSSWAWNFGDGSTSNLQNPFHNYQAISVPTTYTVQLIVSNVFGTSTNTKPDYIYVSASVGLAPNAGFFATQTSGVGPYTTNFVDTSTNDPTGWAWDFGDGNNSSIQFPSHQYQDMSVNTSYTVRLIVSNPFGTSTSTQTNYIYVISTSGALPPFVYNPPSLKVFIGEGYGLNTVFNIEDFNTGGMGTSYSIPTDFLSLGSMVGSFESQGAYSSATTGTNTYQITNAGGSSSADGKVKYSTYKIYKLPKVGLTAGTSWDINVANYTHNTSGLALPPSFGNQGAIVNGDFSTLTVSWVNSSVIRITSLHTFNGPINVDVIASPVSAPPFGSDIDKERIYVYNNLITDGTFSTGNDTTIWTVLELAPGRTNLATPSWIANYTDSAGTQANGVWKFNFADVNGGVKSTPKVSNWITMTNGNWYTMRMRVVADTFNNSHQSILYGYSNYIGAGLQTDIAANALFGIPTTWTWQETALYVHGTLTTGYPQFQFKAGGAGNVYVDELQIINAAPTLVDVNRYFTRLHYPYGDFSSSFATTGWAAEVYPGAGSLPVLSVASGALYLDFTGAGSGNSQKGFKWTADNGSNPPGAATFSVIPGREMGVRATFFKQSGSFNSLGLVLVAAFGVQTSGQQTIAQAPSNLIATAGVGIFPGGTYRTVASAVNGYYQFQFGARSDQPGVLIVTDLDFDRDQDDPNFGDATLFP